MGWLQSAPYRTTPATTPDDNMIEVVHRSLDSRNLLPSEHLVDKGYTDATVLVASQRDLWR
jgi:transposase